MLKPPFELESFCCPKEGLELSEYEDAYSYVFTEDTCRVAIADGATESSFSMHWANLLVEAWKKSEVTTGEFLGQLDEARRVWREHVGKLELPWYAKEKAGMGAFAAFLGFSVDRRSRRWQAVAVGDCCLFQLDPDRRGFRRIETFPIQKSSEFGFSPYLLGTGESNQEFLDTFVKVHSGAVRENDVFFFASDAFSAWLMRRNEENNPVWGITSRIETQDDFQELVNSARKSDGLHNDDTTLVRLTFRG